MDLIRYIPQCSHGHVIVTTRNAELAALAPNTSHALEGLSISDAIRLLMLRVADEQRLPFDIKSPNAATRKAMQELERSKRKTFASASEMMKDFGV